MNESPNTSAGSGALAVYVISTLLAIATLARGRPDAHPGPPSAFFIQAYAFAIPVLGASLSHGDSNESEEDDDCRK